LVVVLGPEAARDAALVALREELGDRAPALDLHWVEENVTPDGLVGSSAFRYVAGDWILTVSSSVVRPDLAVYRVGLVHTGTGVEWAGEVNASGEVSELAG